jgi:hypothetical protein
LSALTVATFSPAQDLSIRANCTSEVITRIYAYSVVDADRCYRVNAAANSSKLTFGI